MLTDVRTAAEKLGCSESHVRRMIKRGAWPVYKLGPGAIRLDPQEIRDLARVDRSKDDPGRGSRR